MAATATVIVFSVERRHYDYRRGPDRCAPRPSKRQTRDPSCVGKIDTAQNARNEAWRRLASHIIGVSAIHGRGTGDLLDTITSSPRTSTRAAGNAPLKLALIGRPNVGKSSLLNALVVNKKASSRKSPAPPATSPPNP